MNEAHKHTDRGGPQQYEESKSVLFPFFSDEQIYIDQLIRLIRKVLCWPTVRPSDIRSIARLLFALERLPYATPGIDLVLNVSCGANENLAWYGVEITEDSMILNSGESIYTPGVGSDTDSRTLFEIHTGGFRTEGEYELEEWLEGFRDLVSGEASAVSVEADYTDDDQIDWDSERDVELWESLPSRYD